MANIVITGDVIAQCTNTLNKVLIAMDLGDGDMFADCFTADGVCRIAINNTHKTGTTELAGLGKALHAKFSKCKHWEGNVCILASDTNTVTNRSYWKAMDGGECVSTGIHEDSLRLQADGQWKIANRIITHTWTKPAATKPTTKAATAAAEALPPPAPENKKKVKKAKAKAGAKGTDAAVDAASGGPTAATDNSAGKIDKKKRERKPRSKPNPAADSAEPTGSVTPKVCRFFKKGACRNGDTCAFVHEKSDKEAAVPAIETTTTPATPSKTASESNAK